MATTLEDGGVYNGHITNLALDKLPNGNMVIQAMVRIPSKGDHKVTLWLDKKSTPQFPVSNFDRSMAVLAHASQRDVHVMPHLCGLLPSKGDAFGTYPLPGEVTVTAERSKSDERYVNLKSIRAANDLKVNNPVDTQTAMAFFGGTSTATDMPPEGDDIPFEEDPVKPEPVKRPPPRRVAG